MKKKKDSSQNYKAIQSACQKSVARGELWSSVTCNLQKCFQPAKAFTSLLSKIIVGQARQDGFFFPSRKNV